MLKASSRCVDRRPPGPPRAPIFGARGNWISFIRNPIRFMDDLHRTFGPIASLAQGTTDYVFVFSPEYNKRVLGDPEVFHNLDASASPLRIPPGSALSRLFSGLTQMNGARHRQQRRVIAPAFQSQRLASYFETVVAITEKTLARWQIGQQRDLFRDMKQLSLSIAVGTLLGLELEDGGEAMCALFERWTSLVFSPLGLLLPVDVPALPYHRLLTVSELLEQELVRIIEQKRRAIDKPSDALSILTQANGVNQGNLTADELVGQTNFLLMAGHATTASALTWTLFLLIQHPKVLLEVLEETGNGRDETTLTMDHFYRLPLLEAVIKESMRLLPPVLWWSRAVTAPVTLGAYDLPRGTRVINSAYITHRSEDQYPQPKKFVPHRWLSMTPDIYAYIPFSAGPRRCIGSELAMMEMKVVLAMLLNHFKLILRSSATIDVGGFMLAAPKPGMPITLGRQDRRYTAAKVRGNIRTVVDLN